MADPSAPASELHPAKPHGVHPSGQAAHLWTFKFIRRSYGSRHRIQCGYTDAFHVRQGRSPRRGGHSGHLESACAGVRALPTSTEGTRARHISNTIKGLHGRLPSSVLVVHDHQRPHNITSCRPAKTSYTAARTTSPVLVQYGQPCLVSTISDKPLRLRCLPNSWQPGRTCSTVQLKSPARFATYVKLPWLAPHSAKTATVKLPSPLQNTQRERHRARSAPMATSGATAHHTVPSTLSRHFAAAPPQQLPTRRNCSCNPQRGGTDSSCELPCP